MLSNLHTHSTFCDGKNTLEEMTLAAIEKGFCSLGFSGHGFAEAESYSMKDTEGYIKEVKRLREKYKKEIEIYLGVEEDAAGLVNRSDFDYIIGSNHLFSIGGEDYAVDLSPEILNKCLELLGGDPIALAENYYSKYCKYIKSRRPDIIAHFDLITKFDEKGDGIFLNNPEYNKIAEKYLCEALKADCMFEVNTGAISRGWRTAPYPQENLLHILKKEGGRIVLNSDSHAADTIDCFFTPSKELLRDIGFTHTYVLYGGEFIKDYL